MLNREAEKGVLNDVYTERERQDVKWGDQSGNTGALWMTILGEEFGESCKAWLEGDSENLRAELVQVAAVAVAAIRSLDIATTRDNVAFATYIIGGAHEPAGCLTEGVTVTDCGPIDTSAHPDFTGEEWHGLGN